MSTPQTTGADLARMALVAARKAAKHRGDPGHTQRKPKRRAAARRDGRDPLGLAKPSPGSWPSAAGKPPRLMAR